MCLLVSTKKGFIVTRLEYSLANFMTTPAMPFEEMFYHLYI